MAKPLSFDPDRTQLFLCWLAFLQLHGGREIRFADAEVDITIDGNTFTALPGFRISGMREMLGGDEQSVHIDFAHAAGASAIFKTNELYNGIFDGARLSLWVIDRNQMPATLPDSERYFIAKIGPTNISMFERGGIDVRSLKEQNVTKTQVYQPTCRTDLFSEFCGKLADDYAVGATVAAVLDAYNITISGISIPAPADGDFDQGYGVTAAGVQFEIRKWVQATQTLTTYLPRCVTGLVEAGMTLTLFPGCDKTIGRCGARFGNTNNFQGEPHSAGYAAAVGGG